MLQYSMALWILSESSGVLRINASAGRQGRLPLVKRSYSQSALPYAKRALPLSLLSSLCLKRSGELVMIFQSAVS